MKVAEMVEAVRNGQTLYISTALKTIKITPRTLGSWESAGLEVLKDGNGDEPGFYVGRGRHYDYIIPGSCKVSLVWEARR